MKDQSTEFGFNEVKKRQSTTHDDLTLESQEDLDRYYSDTRKKKMHFIVAAISSFVLFGCFIMFILWLFFKIIL